MRELAFTIMLEILGAFFVLAINAIGIALIIMSKK